MMAFNSYALRYSLIMSAILGISPAAIAGEMKVDFQVPKIETRSYNRPYIAIWLEDAQQQALSTLLVSSEKSKKKEKGSKYLRDLNQWWRSTGNTTDLPIDGVSRPTYPPGAYELLLTEGQGALPALEAGRYRLMVEAAREKGGREVLEIPFDWPVSESQNLQATGHTELGVVTLELKP